MKVGEMSENYQRQYRYEEVMAELKVAYDNAVEERDQKLTSPWKIDLREKFLKLLSKENKSTLLEIGAGTGNDSLFFQEHGLTVTCIDLSPENVRRCRNKGLNAIEMDFKNLNFPSSTFEAIYAMNCLLHVPHHDFEQILKSLHGLLRPSGVFFLGQFGGKYSEGINPGDHYHPKRFYSFWTDAQIKKLTEDKFTLEHFETIKHNPDDEFHFQHLILRRE